MRKVDSEIISAQDIVISSYLFVKVNNTRGKVMQKMSAIGSRIMGSYAESLGVQLDSVIC